MDIFDNYSNITTSDSSSNNDINPDNELNNSIPKDPEIEQPNPSIATPPFPEEMPIREG